MSSPNCGFDRRANLVEINSDGRQGVPVFVDAIFVRVGLVGLVVLTHHLTGLSQGQTLLTEDVEHRTPGVAEHAEDEVVVAECGMSEVGGLLICETQGHPVFASELVKHVVSLPDVECGGYSPRECFWCTA